MTEPQSPLSTIAQEQAWNRQQMLEPVTRPRFAVWMYDAPAIVLGCSQRKFEDGARARLAPDVELLLRPSGGGAVLTGPWMVSCSVVLPLAHPWVHGRLPDSYQGLGQLHVDLLARLGVPCMALPPDQVDACNLRTGPIVPWACYGSLAPWEVVDAAGRKLVGLAQRSGLADPVPQAMVLTGIVVSVAATALALALARRLHKLTGAHTLPEARDA